MTVPPVIFVEICRSILKIQGIKVLGSLQIPYAKYTHDPLIFLLSVHSKYMCTYIAQNKQKDDENVERLSKYFCLIWTQTVCTDYSRFVYACSMLSIK